MLFTGYFIVLHLIVRGQNNATSTDASLSVLVFLAEATLVVLQADKDHHVKDTYNYVTVQSDIKIPGRHFAVLEDSVRHAAFSRAITAAVSQMETEDKDARVLNLGCSAGDTPVSRAGPQDCMLHALPMTGILQQVWPPAVKVKTCHPPSCLAHTHAWRKRMEG